MKKLVYVFLTALIMLPLAGTMLTACSDEDVCSSNRQMFICVPMRPHPFVPDSLIRDTIPLLTIKTVGKDSVIINQQQNVIDFMLPLKYDSAATSLVFQYNETTTDTVTIQHTNNPYFLSMECGFEIRQTIDSAIYTDYRLQEVVINQSTQSNDGTANLLFIFN